MALGNFTPESGSGMSFSLQLEGRDEGFTHITEQADATVKKLKHSVEGLTQQVGHYGVVVDKSVESVNRLNATSMQMVRGAGVSENVVNKMRVAQERQREETFMSTHRYDENTQQLQKLTTWQKIAHGQWKSAFPALNSLNNALNTVRWTMVNVTFALAALAMITSPFWLLTKSGVEYEKQLRQIAAVSGEIFQSHQGLKAISGAVAGVAIGRPATFAEAATAMLEFQRAGFGLSQAMRDVPHIIDLSVAGFVDLDKATKIVTSTLHQFSQEGLTAQRAADVIAKAAVSSATNVEEFGTALNYAGALAASAGFKFEETAAALALLSNQGMRGSRAGTTLRQVIAKLTKVSADGQAAMDRMGMSFFNAEGHMKSLQEIFTDLNVVMTQLTEQEKQEFLSKLFEIRSKAGVAALLSVIEESSSAIDDFAIVLSESGFAARTAADIQRASALRMKTAWGNLMVALQPIAMSFNDMFTVLIKSVEDFSTRFLVAMRRGGIIDAAFELPITLQFLGLLGVLKLIGPLIFTRVIPAISAATSQAAIMSVAMGAAFGRATIPMAAKTGVLAAPFVTSHFLQTDPSFTLARGSVGLAAGQGVMAAPKMSALKGATFGVTAAFGKLATAIGPATTALLALGVGVLLSIRHFRNLSRETDEQIRILQRYQTSIDILQTREDAYTENFMFNAATRTRIQREELEEQEKEFNKQVKRLNRIAAAAERQAEFKPMALWHLPGEISARFGMAREFGLGALFADPIKIANEARERALELEEENFRALVKASEIQDKIVLNETKAVTAVATFVRLREEASGQFAQYADAEIEHLISTSGHYEEIVQLMNRRNEIQDLLEQGLMEEELAQTELEHIDRRRSNLIRLMLDDLNLVNSELLDQLLTNNQLIVTEQRRLEILRNHVETLKDFANEVRRNLTPQFQRLFDEFGDEGKMFGEEGTLEAIARQFPELADDVRSLISEFDTHMEQLRNLELEYTRVGQAIDHINSLIRIEEAALEGLNDQLRIHDDMISQLASQRFIGETDLDRLIFGVSQEIKKMELESMGIVDVYKFIQDAVNGVEGAFDGVIAAVRNVTEATKTSEDAYDAWRKTVHEHIRTLILQGNDMAIATTDAVKAHMTALQAVSKFQDESQKGMTDEEIMLDALTRARDFYYGGMHEQVRLAVQDQEDLMAVHNQNAETVIRALQAEWDARKPIIDQIQMHEDRIQFLRTEYEHMDNTLDGHRVKYAELELQINQVIEAITGESGLILAFEAQRVTVESLVKEFERLVDIQNKLLPAPNMTTLTGEQVHVRAPTFAGFTPRPLPVVHHDFDTTLGAGTRTDMGNVVTISNLNINTNTNDPKRLADELSYEITKIIKRDLQVG